MSQHLDIDPEAERLLRRTLQGRAELVTEGPEWTGSAPDHRRRRTLPAVAAAVAAVLAASVLAIAVDRRPDTGESAGPVPASCSTALPHLWKRAVHSPPVTVGGRQADVDALLADETVVLFWIGADGSEHVDLRPSTGTDREVASGPALSVVGVTGSTVVVTAAASSKSHVSRLVIANAQSGEQRQVSVARLLPTGLVLHEGRSAVLDGTVYLAGERADQPADRPAGHSTGAIVAYDLATHTSKTVARTGDLLSGGADPRGVFWRGGGVRRRVPDSIPPFHSAPAREVVSDGRAFAWTDHGTADVVHWVDQDGDERQWRVRLADGGTPYAAAVSGPFVVLSLFGYGDPHVYVLDARTGALADTGIQSEGLDVARDGKLAIGTRHNDHAPHSTELLDTEKLPGLHC